MRVVVLCSSPYSETGCAVTARLAERGHTPIGVVTLAAWDRSTLIRKVGQWGLRESLNYAAAKLGIAKSTYPQQVRNPHLENVLRHEGKAFRSVRELSRVYGFPVFTCSDQNGGPSLSQLRSWSPDLVVFTGGNILRDPVLKIARVGVINTHLALLPEVRGMSSPEWSLLAGVPLGITIHFMDQGIDTGRILLRREFVGENCDSFTDLRNLMIAEGIELLVECIEGLSTGRILPLPQNDQGSDRQFFVMHEKLKAVAAQKLKTSRLHPAIGRRDG